MDFDRRKFQFHILRVCILSPINHQQNDLVPFGATPPAVGSNERAKESDDSQKQQQPLIPVVTVSVELEITLRYREDLQNCSKCVTVQMPLFFFWRVQIHRLLITSPTLAKETDRKIRLRLVGKKKKANGDLIQADCIYIYIYACCIYVWKKTTHIHPLNDIVHHMAERETCNNRWERKQTPHA